MKTIAIQVDEQLFQHAQMVAASRHSTVQDLLVEMLRSLAEPEGAEALPAPELPEFDPITPLIGSLQINTHDLGENHDFYIGQALMRELRQPE